MTISSSSKEATTLAALTSSLTRGTDVQDTIISSRSSITHEKTTVSSNNKNNNNNKGIKNSTRQQTIPPLMPYKSSSLIVSNNTKTQQQQESSSSRRTLVLRTCFIASLSAAAVVCGLVAHTVIMNLEREVGAQTYESVAAGALEAAHAAFQRKLQAGRVMASIIGDAFPNASQWPLVALEGYEAIAQQVVALLSVSVYQTFAVLVQPEQRVEFETFARTVYQKHGYPKTAGYSDFGFGIWKPESNQESPLYSDGRMPDTNGTTSYGSSWDILIPLFLHSDLNSRNLLFNLHSAPTQGRALDWMRACMEVQSSAATVPRKTNSTNDTVPTCDVVTDFLELAIDSGPSGMILQPIYPVKDYMALVGVIATSLQWHHILTHIVPDYVEGLICVIATETSSYTFVIHGGVPILHGPGDLHDRHFSRYGRKVILHHPNRTLQPAITSATYTLTVYPTDRMFDVFRTSSPRIVSVGFVSIIVVCIALFLLYDYFMKYEAHQRRQLLDMKRRFVRFISHEIRTPLNCVCMGLELLQDDLRQHASDQHHHHLSPQSLCEQKNTRKYNSDTRSTDKKADKDDNDNKPSNSNEVPVDKSSHIVPEAQHNDTNQCSTQISGDPLPSTPPTPNRPCSAVVQSCLELTSDVYENTKNAVAVLDDLLNFDKIQTGTFQLEVGKVRIWDLIRTTVLQFKVQAQNKRIALHTCIGQDVPDQVAVIDIDFELDEESAGLPLGLQISALGDDMKLGQALRNLISNAIKFTPEGGAITVTASYKRDGLPKAKSLTGGTLISCVRSGSVCIRVHDTGAGMSPDQLKSLFQDWVQFDANRRQTGGGSGLGLCITKEIIEQHGGTIAAESCGLGKGATFIMELPLYEFPRDHEHNHKKLNTEGETLDPTDEEAGTVDDLVGNTGASTTATSETDASTWPIKQIQHRILVVEDVLSSRRLLVRLLERAGHVCGVAANGQEAIDCYLADKAATVAVGQPGPLLDSTNLHIPYDTILMDSEMPLLTGPEATKQLRELGCTASIVGITGNVLQADVEFFKAHGADEVLPKPVDISLLEHFWANISTTRK